MANSIRDMVDEKVAKLRSVDSLSPQEIAQESIELSSLLASVNVEIVDRKFIIKWRDEWLRKNMVLRDIYSDTYLEVRDQFYEKRSLLYDPKIFISRYVPSKILNITCQMDMYDDVLAIYNWHESEIFGVEIYNEHVANLHKQLFEIVWKMATPV